MLHKKTVCCAKQILMQKNRESKPKFGKLDYFLSKPSGCNEIQKKDEKKYVSKSSYFENPKDVSSNSPQTSPKISTFDEILKNSNSSLNISNDSDSSSPNTEPNNTWDESASSSMGISISSTPTSRMDVVMPNWHFEGQIPLNHEPNTFTSNLGQIELHYNLEVLEHRIQQGDDQFHDHPGQCVNVFLETGVGALTPEEIYFKKGYVLKKPEIIVPSFWPPRVWDNQCITLNPEESEKLVSEGLKQVHRARHSKRHQEEDDFEPSDSDDFEIEPEEKIPAPRARNPRSHTTMVTRSAGNLSEVPERITKYFVNIFK